MSKPANCACWPLLKANVPHSCRKSRRWPKPSPASRWLFGTRPMAQQAFLGEIITRLNSEIGRILFLPEVKKQMEDIAVEVAKSSPDQLAKLTRADAEKWGKIIKELNITSL